MSRHTRTGVGSGRSHPPPARPLTGPAREGPGRGAARVARGAVLATVCLALSLGGHAAGGGQVQLTEGLLFGGLLLSAICVAAAERRRTFAGIAAVVVVSQVVLHLVAQASTHTATTTQPLEMIAWHGVAALVASVLLAQGERLAWDLWSLTRLPRIPRFVRLLPAVVRPLPDVAPAQRPASDTVLAGGATRRGPPSR